MSNVIGPFNLEDWVLMSTLKGALGFMKSNNKNGRFDLALKQESKLYYDHLDKYLSKAA